MGATGSPSSGACCTVLSKHFIDVLPPVLYPSYLGGNGFMVFIL